MVGRARKSQAAIDFITAYGFAILIITIAVYAVLQLGIFNYSSAPQYCYSQSPFSCVAYSINTTGSVALVISQSSGGILNVTGAACSTTPNTTRIGPKFGNVNIVTYSAHPSYYPNSNLNGGLIIYPGAQAVIYIKCYSSNIGTAGSAIGNTFTGYVWINYTFSGLPSSYHNVANAASLSVKYT
jgi:hypothetical protein